MVVPPGTTTGVATCAGSLSRTFHPETFTGEAERFFSSTQSATWSPLDSTSLMTTSGGPDGSSPAHVLAAPSVSVTTPNDPVPLGQRPQSVACVSTGYVVESSRLAR